ISSQWPTFFDFFQTTIHENPKITPVRKLQILHNVLGGEAKERIRNIPFNAQGYEEAWNSLIERYDDKPSITTEIISTFMNMKSTTQGVAAELRRITDTADQVLRGLKIMGSDCEARDPWLIYIILSKVDTETKIDWARETVSNNFPKISELLNFLNKRCRSLERGAAINVSKPHKLNVRSFHVSSCTVKNSELCLHCKGNHFLSKCPTFKLLDASSRRSIAAKIGCCFNCLRKGHYNTQCKFQSSCQLCSRKHHSLLHLSSQESSSNSYLLSENTLPSSNSQQNNDNKNNFIHQNNVESTSTNVVTHVAQTMSMLVNVALVSLLPTAVAFVKNQSQDMLPVRILLDSGSQSSFITESCVQRLGLKRIKNSTVVNGLSGKLVAKANGRVLLNIYERLEKTKIIEADALIIKTITSIIPTTNIKIIDTNFFNKFFLADPKFYQPGKKGILLGCDCFFKVLGSKRIERPNLPIAQESKFGWLMVGAVQDIQSTTLGFHVVHDVNENERLSAVLKQFWELEAVPEESKPSTEESLSETIFKNSTIRGSD
ncbi:MAG TPA: hypothetical protein DDZ41_03185, partial [Flavobacterium sp.]|nr:hypothetical protein [Flavobacterium sp.]